MGARIDAFDWSRTPIGSIASWSPSLKMMVRLVLANRFPMILCWGPDFIQIYNDAYRPILGTRHPEQGIGCSVRECWPETWHRLRPLIETPFRGGNSTWGEDILLEINRHGYLEETHFTVAYSPVPDETAPGGIGGVLGTVHEISAKVVSERRVIALRDISERLSEANSAEHVCNIAAKTLAAHDKDVPFVLFYLLDAEGKCAHLRGVSGGPMAKDFAPETIELGSGKSSPWPFDEALKRGSLQVVTDLQKKFRSIPPGPWSDAPHTAVVVAIPSNISDKPAAFMVAGASARLKFDAFYRDFFELLRTQVASALAGAQADETERRNRERLELLTEASQVGVWLCDLPFNELTWDFRVKEHFWLPANARVTIDDFFARIHPDDRELARQAIEHSIRDKTRYNIDYRTVSPDGRQKWIRAIGHAHYDAQGRPIRFDGVTIDVTESKLAEARTRFLLGLDDALRSLADPDEITIKAAQILGEYLDVDRCAYADVEGDADTMNLTGNYLRSPEIKSIVGRLKFSDFGPEALQLMRQGKPYIVQDIATHEPPIPNRAAYQATQIQSVICVPLHKSGKFVAAMAVHMRTPRHWTADEVELLSAVAARCWESIERARLQRGLSESQLQYRSLFESIDEGFCVIEMLFDAQQRPVDYRFVEVNPAFEKQAGMHDATGKRMLEFVSSIEQHWLENYGRVAMTGEPIRFADEYKSLHSWFDVYAFRVGDPSERKVAVIFNNITKRKQAERAQSESEERFRAFVTTSTDVMYRMNADWTEMRHLEGKDFIANTENPSGAWLEEYIFPEDRQLVRNAIDEAIRTKSPFKLEHRVIRVDGSVGWTFSRAVPLFDARGEIREWFGAATDVTERHRAEESLRDEARILELLKDTGSAIAAQLDLATLVQMVTDAATKLCGAQFGAFFYNAIDSRGESYLLYSLSGAPREAFDKFGMPRDTPVFNITFTGQGVMRSDDITKDPRYGTMAPHYGMPKGHLPVRSYLAAPVVSRSGEVIGGLFFGHSETKVFTERSERIVAGVAAQAAIAIDNARLYEAAQREIAERKRVAEELQKAKEELSHHAEDLEKQVSTRTASLREALSQLEEFSYSVSHDLRAPLRAIVGYSRVFREDYGAGLPTEANEYLDKISRSAQRMERLVNEVLTLSRVTRADLQLHPVRLQQFIDDLVEQNPLMQPPAADVKVATPHTVMADEARLGQAISNLLSNAVKFVAPGENPVVRVRSEDLGERVRIWVEDHGIGIPMQHRGKLFGMFQRLPSDQTYEGTGIGLAIVRKAVEVMGGSVGIESNEPKGSRFWIELRKDQS